MNKTGKSLSFKYNESGIRTQKTYNNVTTDYLLDGTTIRGQKSSNSSVPIMFYYDASGKPAWMHYNSNAYYYVYNVQGDVIAIYDNTGTTVVEYVYDAWGNILMTSGSLASTVGAVNPFRYRGYYYDTETGLYYLNSRYYNPEWCRFINADGIIGANGDIISSNLFAYCSNNPVNFYDPSGMCMYDNVKGIAGEQLRASMGCSNGLWTGNSTTTSSTRSPEHATSTLTEEDIELIERFGQESFISAIDEILEPIGDVGTATAFSFGWDVIVDCYTYEGSDLACAIAIDAGGAAAGAALSTALIGVCAINPAGLVAFGIGVLIGVGMSYATDKAKDVWLPPKQY